MPQVLLRVVRIRFVVGIAILVLSASHLRSLAAQSTFDLSVPGRNGVSLATVSDQELSIVDGSAQESVYFRDPRSDSADGTWLAYRSDTLGQIIRWPSSGRGTLEIGTLRGTRVDYRASQMQILPRSVAVRPVLPPQSVPRQPVNPLARQGGTPNFFTQLWQPKTAQPQWFHMATRDDRGREWRLGQVGVRPALLPAGDLNLTDWLLVPAAPGYVRVQQSSGGRWMGLGVNAQRTLFMDNVGQDIGQLWHVVQPNYGTGGYWLESAYVPGFALDASGGAIGLAPIHGGVGQLWWPSPVQLAPTYEPMWRSVNHEIRSNPPLEPAQIDIVNTHRYALVILIGDQRTAQTRQMRIEPGSQTSAVFDRDAGATVVETYEVRGPSGVWDRQQFVTQIPPTALYDLSVYEEFLQSIAIDRTGTSPNPIEDVNYQPRSIGWLPLPAGSGLPARGQFDAFAQARAANNPGAVRRFDPKSLEKPTNAEDPLESILKGLAPPAKPRQKF